MQETHASEDNSFKKEWGGELLHSFGTSKTGGVTMMFSKNLKVRIMSSKIDTKGRFICCLAEIEDRKILLVNVYAPNTDDPNFFLELINQVEDDSFSERDITLIRGDFNLVLEPKLDRYKSSGNHTRSCNVITEYMKQVDLCDIWRVRNPETKRFTWHRPVSMRASRIDMFLIPVGYSDLVTDCAINYGIQSDHSIVELTLKIDNYQRGAGIWKLNNKILLNTEYQEGISVAVEDAIAGVPLGDDELIWIEIKRACIEYSKSFTKSLARSNRIELHDLYKVKSDLMNELYKTISDQKTIQDSIKEIDISINRKETEKTEASIFRSRCQWVNEGERNSKFFFGLEKRNYMNKNLKCVVGKDGKVTYKQKEILNMQTSFYKELYTNDRNVEFKLKREDSDPQIDVTQKEYCEADISFDEIFDAVMTLKSNKCPGCDGLTPEFYRTFFGILKKPLYNMYKHAFKRKRLPLSTRRGVISLLPKGQKDRRYIQNLRPLTLQNCDYKILAKLFDNRIREVLPSVIHTDQTGFLPGRNISTNIRKSIDIMHYCRQEKIPALILSIDMEKCFDKISYSAIFGALDYFGFGPIFSQWVKLFFTEFMVCTQNFGILSQWFYKERSVNQGCNISPSLFLLAGEILSLKLRKHKQIKGIKIIDTEFLISQFADDMDLYIPYDVTVLNAVLEVLDNIEANLGLKVSYDKTTIYRIGSLENSNAKLYVNRKVKWSSESINTLGIDLYYDHMDRNFDKICDKMRTVMETWYYRTLTLMGKIVLVNTLIGSLFVYKMQVISYIPPSVFKKIDKEIEQFIWNKKKPKIPMNILKMHKMDGGLSLVSLEAKHQALMLKTVQNMQNNVAISTLAKYFLGKPATANLCWKVNLHVNDLMNMITKVDSFWYDVVKNWCKINYHIPTSRDEIKNQIIWFNSHIRIGNKSVINWEAYDAGLVVIDDIISQGKPKKYSPSMKMSWLEYYSLCKAIPAAWLQALKENDEDHTNEVETGIFSMIKKANFTRIIYRQIIKEPTGWSKSGRKWQDKIGEQFDWNVHQKAFEHLYTITNVVKLRNFQFRLLYNTIFCNDVLYYWKLVPTQLCNLCHRKKQTIEHMLFRCYYSRKIWKMYINTVTEKGYVCDLSWFNIVYNLVYPKRNSIFNFITLVIKFYLYRCKCSNEIPRWEGVENEIMLYHRIEQHNAHVNNKLAKHVRKWSPIIPQESEVV